jgi:hypothetical protein
VTWSIPHWLSAFALRDVLAVAVATAAIRLSGRAGLWCFAFAALPGTLAHETAHFIVAWLLGGEPAFPSIVPRRTATGWHLGEVRFRAGHVRAMCVGLAPLLLMPLALWWMAIFVATSAPGVWLALHAWICGALLTAAWPSRADWRLAAPASVVVVVLAMAVAMLLEEWPA